MNFNLTGGNTSSGSEVRVDSGKLRQKKINKKM
jgi:hypothetical protein